MRLTRIEKAFIRAYRSDARAKQGGHCEYCRDRLTERTATADHVIPRKHGGVDRSFNIVAACRSCNILKGHRSKGEYMARLREPEPGAPIALLMRHLAYRINKALQRLERRVSKSVRGKR